MEIHRIAKKRTGGDSTYNYASFSHTSFCCAINAQILNCPRRFSEVYLLCETTYSSHTTHTLCHALPCTERSTIRYHHLNIPFIFLPCPARPLPIAARTLPLNDKRDVPPNAPPPAGQKDPPNAPPPAGQLDPPTPHHQLGKRKFIDPTSQTDIRLYLESTVNSGRIKMRTPQLHSVKSINRITIAGVHHHKQSFTGGQKKSHPQPRLQSTHPPAILGA